MGPLLAALGAPDPTAAQPMDPAMVEQAVWDTFPGTDPDILAQLSAGITSGDPEALVSLVGTIRSLQSEDERRLEQMHSEQLDALLAQLMMPAPGAEIDEAQPAPVVGGEGLVY